MTGRVDEALDAGERHHLVEAAGDLGALHAQDGAVEVNVLAAGQLRVEAGADFEQAADPSADFCPALGRLGDARQNLEQRALAGTVVADHAEDLAGRNLQRDVAQRPDRVVGVLLRCCRRIAGGGCGALTTEVSVSRRARYVSRSPMR